MSKLDLEKQFIADNTIPRYAKAGKVVKAASKVGELLSEAEKQIALEKFRAGKKMSKAENEAIGLYHEIGGGPKLKKPVEEYTFETRNDPRFETLTRRILSPEDLYGKVGIPLVGDRARAGKLLTSVEGRELTNPVALEGGPEFMMNHPYLWASDKSVITKLANQARKAAETGKEVVGVNVVGSPTNVDFNAMVSKTLIDNLDLSSLRKKDIKEFNAEMRKTYPNFVGIESPELEAQLTAPKMGNMRTLFVDRMNQAKYQEVGFPDVAAARIAVTDPRLLDVPTGTAGFTVGRVDPENLMIEVPEIRHETYPVKMGGEYVGGLEAPVDFREVFPEFNEARRLLGAEPQRDLRSFTFQSPAIQEFDQEWLDRIMPTYEKILKSKRYAGGGKVGRAAKALEELQKLYNAAEAEKKAEKAVEAPAVMKRSGITELKKQIEERKGKYSGQRVEKAGDLVPNLEQQYTQSALMRAFTGDGDNAAGVMVINPKDFEKYAAEIPPDYVNQKNIDELAAIARDSGFSDVPYLLLHRDEIDSIPKELQELMIAGHEGRHRTRALKELGDEATLVRMIPRASMREHLPRRSQEEYIDALNKELGLYPLVRPEANFDMESELLINRPLVKLPKIFKDGGKVDLNEEFVKENTLAEGGSPYGKGSGRPVHGKMQAPDWEVVKRAGQLAGRQLKKELTEATPKQTAIDVAGGLVADTLGFPADVANWRPTPMDSKAKPFGMESRSLLPKDAEERTPIAGSENFRRMLQENNIISGVERPLTEGISTLVSPAALVKAPKAAKGIAKLVKELEDMPAGMSVKPVGGQWDDTTRFKIEDKLGNVTQNEDVSNWLKTTGRKYLMNRMGTPDDEIRKLLDKDISHLPPNKLSELDRYMSLNDKEMVRAKRKIEGFPAEGEADTAAGKKWEMMTDEWVNPNPASLYQDPRFIESNPWVAKLDPETRVYSGERGAAHLVNETGMHEVAEALERSIKEGTLKPEQLNKVSMEDAVKLAHSYRVKDEAEVAKELPVLFDYPESGMSWHEITHEDPETLRKILKREGETMQNCIGNYCEDVTEDGTRLFSLRDKSGKPHVNIELKPTQGVMFSQMEAELGDKASQLLEAGWTPKEIVNKYPELNKYRQYRVNQIKGKQNEAPIHDYIPFVQDFIKNQGPFTEVRDLGNAGLLDLRRAKEHGVFDEEIPAINRELFRLFPSEKSPYGGSIMSGQYGVKISPDQMLREVLKDMEGDYTSTDEIVNYLRQQEPRPVEQSYSRYWKDKPDELTQDIREQVVRDRLLNQDENMAKGGKITKSNLDEEFKLNRYMR